MDSHTRKVLNRRWRGRSHRCGGERIRVLIEKITERLDRQNIG